MLVWIVIVEGRIKSYGKLDARADGYRIWNSDRVFQRWIIPYIGDL